MTSIQPRAYDVVSSASSWEEIWEAGSYYQRISELLEEAIESVVFVGWQVDSRLPLHRPFRPGALFKKETLKEKVIRLCNSKPNFHAYFLMWDHAYFYALERETMQGRIWENIHPRIHFVFDNRHPFGGAHHEKLVIIDSRIALCGSIDLCDERWDSPAHYYRDPRRSLHWKREHHGPYHDLAVQVTGPICAEIQRHISQRWKYISSIPFPPASRRATSHKMNGHRVYLSRTIAPIDNEHFGASPVVREIEFMTRELIQKAEHRIILEGQYYWSAQFNDLLIEKMLQMAGKPFEVILILANLEKIKSLTRHMIYYQLKLLDRLENAAKRAGTKLILGNPYVSSSITEKNRKPVYVHSKTILIDDRFLSIGSANFAARAYRVDTELNLTLEATTAAERSHLQRFGKHLLGHWNVQNEPDRHVHLYRIHPKQRSRELRKIHPWASRIAWNRVFDPKAPMFYPLKRRYRKITRNHKGLVSITSLTLSILTTLVSWKLAQVETFWEAIYSMILTSVWLLPIPFVPISVLATLHIGYKTAAPIAVIALWIAGITGYGLTRAFPTATARFYRKTAPSWLPRQIALRSFPYLISVLADPRVALRSKIAYQGLYCVPLPWFTLGTLLVLPSAIYVLSQCIGTFTSSFMPQHFSKIAGVLTFVLTGFGAARIISPTLRIKPNGPKVDSMAAQKD